MRFKGVLCYRDGNLVIEAIEDLQQECLLLPVALQEIKIRARLWLRSQYDM